MPGFSYYLPGRTAKDLVAGKLAGGKIRPDVLDAHGLGHLFDVEQAGVDGVVTEIRQHGPDGSNGVVLHVRSETEKRTVDLDEDWAIGYEPNRQVWTKAIAGNFWLGYTQGFLPTANDLIRATYVGGCWVPDAAGQAWIVPCARSPEKKYGLLPTCIARGDGGGTVERLKERYVWLWELANTIWDAIHSRDVIDNEQALAWIEQILQCNYRFGPSEHRVLFDAGVDLVDQNFITLVGMTLVDARVAENTDPTTQKKTETPSAPAEDTSGSTPGEAASTPTSSPASAS